MKHVVLRLKHFSQINSRQHQETQVGTLSSAALFHMWHTARYSLLLTGSPYWK